MGKVNRPYIPRTRKHLSCGMPLKTSSKSVAVVRNNEVSKKEDLIKEGGSWNFAWLNDEGKSELLRITISDAYDEY